MELLRCSSYQPWAVPEFCGRGGGRSPKVGGLLFAQGDFPVSDTHIVDDRGTGIFLYISVSLVGLPRHVLILHSGLSYCTSKCHALPPNSAHLVTPLPHFALFSRFFRFYVLKCIRIK